MKLLFWGRGAVGTQYAWAFENAGHIVLHEEIRENHDYDLIFMSVNAEQVPGVVEYLAPRVGHATVLFIGNFWQDIQKSVYPIPLSRVVWGFPGCGGGFEGNNLYGGFYKTVHFGIFESEPAPRDVEVHRLFAGAGFSVVVKKDFQSWLMNHFASNTAMEVEVLKNGSFQDVTSSREALCGINRNLKEMIPVLKAKGVKIDVSTKMMSLIPPKAFGFLMGHIVFSPNSISSATIAHNHYKAGHAVQEIISEARQHGIKVPRLCEVEHLISQ